MQADVSGWLTDRNETPLRAQHTPAFSNTPPSPQRAPGSSDVADSTQGTSPISTIDHTNEDRQVCNRPPSNSQSNSSQRPIYKWTDDQGQTHMSDQRPRGRIASLVDMGTIKQDFTYEIIPDGISVPIDFPGQLSAGSKRIYDTWHFFLGADKLRQSRIQLKLIGGPERFNAYHAKAYPGRKPVNGFYSMRKNLAVVKFDDTNLDQTLSTTFHETSHLITASHLGPTPPWLTEGLAEYFENMKVRGQGGAIHPNKHHIKLLRSKHLPDLRSYLSIGRPEWYADQRSRNYAIAWSLVHFLMQGAPGMYALQDMIQQAHANFCIPFSPADALGNAYPGGMRRLESDWRKWFSEGNFQVHQT